MGKAATTLLFGDEGDDTMSAEIFQAFGDAGIDRVTDFSLVQGDRAAARPYTQFTVSRAGRDTVIDMIRGKMILVSVQMSTLTPGWISRA